MSYSPLPGTVAYRALEWLKAQPAGTEVTMSVWGEAIGVDALNMHGNCVAIIKRGLVERFTKNGQTRPAFFRIPGPDFKIEPPEKDEPIHAKAPSHAEVVAMARNGNGALPGALLDQLSKPAQRAMAPRPTPPIAAAQATPVAERAARPPKPAAAATDGLRCALWSDGTLTIVRRMTSLMTPVHGERWTGKSHTCTPAGARTLPIHEQLLKMASKATGVDCPEASVALTICRKTASLRLGELVDEGLLFRAAGGWQGKRIRWFRNQAHAAIFSEGGRKVMAPKEVEKRARIAAQLRKAGVVHTVAPIAPHRYVADPSIRGPFSSAGIGRYVEPASGWVAAMGGMGAR